MPTLQQGGGQVHRAGDDFVGHWQELSGREPGRMLIFSRPDGTGSLGMQVTHLRQYGEMLRIQTHEFANKLSSLSGLLQLGHVDQAVDLIQQENEACQNMLQDLLRVIENKPVAGLILGKFSRARELGWSWCWMRGRPSGSIRPRCRRISSPASATCWTTAFAPPGEPRARRSQGAALPR